MVLPIALIGAGCFLGTIAGCEAVSVLGAAVRGKGDAVPKLYQLPAKRTVILVDAMEGAGVTNVLSPRGMRSLIASDMGYLLEQEKALPPGMLVPLRELDQVASQLGDDFALTPIDEIARRVGAQQVIHVVVEESSMRVLGTLFRPVAAVQVKVIDVEQGKRVFPQAMNLSTDGGGASGHRLSVPLESVDIDQGGPTVVSIYTRKLAQEVALHSGRLFYDWNKPDLGSKIK